MLEAATDEDKQNYATQMEKNKEVVLTINGKEVKVSNEYLSYEWYDQIIQEEKYVPSVIEPSFGLGRIMYCIFEHCFKMREEDA